MEARFPRLRKGGWVTTSESFGGKVKEPTGVGGEEEEAILSGGSAEVVIHGGVGGAVSGNDDAAGEPDGESGGDGGVGWLERVIPLCPYVPNPLIDNVFAKLSLGIARILSCAIIDTSSQMYRHLSTGPASTEDLQPFSRWPQFQGNLKGTKSMARMPE